MNMEWLKLIASSNDEIFSSVKFIIIPTSHKELLSFDEPHERCIKCCRSTHIPHMFVSQQLIASTCE